MRQQATIASPVEVDKYLEGIDFPASKHGLIQHARDHHAPDYVLKTLQRLPEREFDNAADVAKDMGKD